MVLALLASPGLAAAGELAPGAALLAQAPSYPYYGTYYPQFPTTGGAYPGYAPAPSAVLPGARSPIDPYASLYAAPGPTVPPRPVDPYSEPYAAPATVYVAAAQPTRLQPVDPYAGLYAAPSPLVDPYARPYAGQAGSLPAKPALADPYSTASTTTGLRPTTAHPDAAEAVLGCIDAFEVDHVEAARTGCALALTQDSGLALAHLYAARVAEDAVAFRHELTLAASAVARASLGERLLVTGFLKWQAGDLDAAGRAYGQLVAAYPDERRAWTWRGEFRLATGDASGAAADFARAVALDGRSPAARRYRGLALAALGQHEPALAALRDYARLAPSEPNPHHELARALLRADQPAQAASEARKALSLDGDYLSAYASLGDALLASGKLRPARQAYEKLLDRHGERSELRHDGALRLARVLLAERRVTEAERAFLDEAERASAAGRPLEAAESLLCATRSYLLRGASAEAQRTLHKAEALLRSTSTTAARAVGVGVLSRRQLEESVRVAQLQLAAGF